MSRIIIFGATGSLGSHVLRRALEGGHQVTAFVRSPSRLPAGVDTKVSVHAGDLSIVSPLELARLIRGHDTLINCAGFVTEGQVFIELVGRLVASLELLPKSRRPVAWFLAGAALLDITPSGRKGVELPKVRSAYWPHQANFERLSRTDLDWRLLCPGPMVDQPALGLDRLRVTLDTLPVQVPSIARSLPGWLLLPVFASRVPEMIVPYADAAAFMLAHLDRGNAMNRHRVGLALPVGMRGKKPRWQAKPSHGN